MKNRTTVQKIKHTSNKTKQQQQNNKNKQKTNNNSNDSNNNKTTINLIIIIIAFKGAIRDFLHSPHSAANCLQHVRSSGQGAIVCKSRATHRALITCKCMLRVTWYGGTTQLLSLTELKSDLSELFISLAKPLNR